LSAEVEVGGTDQRFNLLMGRTLQREYGQEPQIALMMPILEGLDGFQKMSKSLGNYIGIEDPPKEIYGKVMSLDDRLMIRYFELVTMAPVEEVEVIKNGLEAGKLHPRDLKMQLARDIVSIYHDKEAALEAEKEFVRVFQQREMPAEIEEFKVSKEILENGSIWLPKLMMLARMVKSTSEGRRLIDQGAVKINGEKVTDQVNCIVPADGMILQAGKRKFIRLKI